VRAGTQTICFPRFPIGPTSDTEEGFRAKFNCVARPGVVCVFLMTALTAPFNQQSDAVSARCKTS
jgi:alpha-D-ribose 1-methylphosphonate 5-triphosphate synthase subunit PhnH